MQQRWILIWMQSALVICLEITANVCEPFTTDSLTLPTIRAWIGFWPCMEDIGALAACWITLARYGDCLHAASRDGYRQTIQNTLQLNFIGCVKPVGWSISTLYWDKSRNLCKSVCCVHLCHVESICKLHWEYWLLSNRLIFTTFDVQIREFILRRSKRGS